MQMPLPVLSAERCQKQLLLGRTEEVRFSLERTLESASEGDFIAAGWAQSPLVTLTRRLIPQM